MVSISAFFASTWRMVNLLGLILAVRTGVHIVANRRMAVGTNPGFVVHHVLSLKNYIS